VSDTLTNVLATIRQRESGGDYTSARYGAQGASGAYQYIFSTWQAWANRAGFGQYAGTPAAAAPPAVQDAVAAANVQSILAGAGGNVAAVPMAWYTGNPNHSPTWDLSVPSDAAGYRANNGYEPGQYVADWMATYAQVSGSPATTASAYSSSGASSSSSSSLIGSLGGSVKVPILGSLPLVGGLFNSAASSATTDLAKIAITGILLLGATFLVAGGAWRAVSPTVKPKLDEARQGAGAAAGAAAAAA
jgi:hypothetical protein